MTKHDEALDVLHALILDDGRRWGDAATTEQRRDAAAILDPDAERRAHLVTRPKGGSKSTDLAGVGIAWLLSQAEPRQEGYAAAADLDQANRLLDRARGLIARTGLGALLRVEARRITNVATGARVEALASDASSAEGLLSPLLILDEIANWPRTPKSERMLTALVSAIPKVPGSRFVTITHAGDPAHFAHKLLVHAKASPAWRVSEWPGPLPWVSDADLREQRALLLPSEYARRHLNVWTAGEDRIAAPDDIAACVKHQGPLAPLPGVRYVMTLDIGLKNDRTVLAVAHAVHGHESSRVILDRMHVWEGTREKPVKLADVEAAIRLAHDRYNRPRLVCDPWNAAQLMERLKAAGVGVDEFTFSQSSKGKLSVTLFRLLRDHLVELPDDDELIEELGSVRLVEKASGAFAIDHDAGRHDDRVITLALACWWHVDHAPRKPIDTPAPGGSKKAPWRSTANASPWW